MSTVKKRPQLELDELRRLKWLLGGILALIAISSLLYLDIDARLMMIASFVLVPLVLLKPAWPARLPLLVDKLAFPAVVSAGITQAAAGDPGAVRIDIPGPGMDKEGGGADRDQVGGGPSPAARSASRRNRGRGAGATS